MNLCNAREKRRCSVRMNACDFPLFLFLFTLLVCHNMTSSADKGQHFALLSRKTTNFAARIAYKTDKFTCHSSV
jgi:hypothetical protein